MSKHTKEPWFLRLSDNGTAHIEHGAECFLDDIGCSENKITTLPAEITQSYNSHENAKRIVLCVNACAGMADPAAEIAELKRQRDELLAALHDAATSLETIQLRSFGSDSCLDDKHSMRAYAGSRSSVARAAIAKTKGGAE